MKTFRELRESHYPTQGSSIEYPEYKEMDMENLVQDAIGDMAEDDGPHTSKIEDPINFQTVDDPSKVINKSSSEGNREHPLSTAPRMSGKPFKSLRKKRSTYGGEDFSGAVAGVAIGEAKEDPGEYDYEGEMAKSQLRSILHNAKMLHDMLEENTNLPEWVQSKITLAEDYVVTAAQYMQSQLSEDIELEEKKMDNPCWKGYTAYGTKMKNGREVPNCVPIKEGSARAAFTKRGFYAKTRNAHLQAVDASEKSRGVKNSPTTDARSYGRTHTTSYTSNDPETKKGESLRKPKKQAAVPLPRHDDPAKSGSRITDILNHPHYKKMKQS